MWRYRLTIEVFSELDPSQLLDEIQDIDLDETEVDFESATVTDLGYGKHYAKEARERTHAGHTHRIG